MIPEEIFVVRRCTRKLTKASTHYPPKNIRSCVDNGIIEPSRSAYLAHTPQTTIVYDKPSRLSGYNVIHDRDVQAQSSLKTNTKPPLEDSDTSSKQISTELSSHPRRELKESFNSPHKDTRCCRLSIIMARSKKRPTRGITTKLVANEFHEIRTQPESPISTSKGSVQKRQREIMSSKIETLEKKTDGPEKMNYQHYMQRMKGMEILEQQSQEIQEQEVKCIDQAVW